MAEITPTDRGRTDALQKIASLSEEDLRRAFEVWRDIARHNGVLDAYHGAYVNTILREGYSRGW